MIKWKAKDVPKAMLPENVTREKINTYARSLKRLGNDELVVTRWLIPLFMPIYQKVYGVLEEANIPPLFRQ
ncbi:MAG: hypothetical protein WAU15_10630 [Nitrosomonas sp.]